MAATTAPKAVWHGVLQEGRWAVQPTGSFADATELYGTENAGSVLEILLLNRISKKYIVDQATTSFWALKGVWIGSIPAKSSRLNRT